MNRIVLTIVGFLLFVLGFLALILGFIGLGLWPISFLDTTLSPTLSFVAKLTMMVLGLVFFYVGRVDQSED